MRKLLFALLSFPLISMGQKSLSAYSNDTLYTTSGFKIYKGQTLYFGNGTRTDGKFRFINIKNETTSYQLANNSMVVKKMKNYGVSILGNGYIELIGRITYRDGSKGYVDIHMAFDRAIEDSPGLPSELIVPNEYRNKKKKNEYKGSIADEIEKLNKLYQQGILTKEEYEAQKRKLLDQ